MRERWFVVRVAMSDIVRGALAVGGGSEVKHTPVTG